MNQDNKGLNEGGELARSGLIFAFSSSLFLFVMKIATFIYSGSLVVLASAFDSLSDAVVSLVNARISKEAREGADSQHPFGHGGFEVVGAIVQGIVILFLGYNLIAEAVRKLITPTSGAEVIVERFPLAAGVLILSAAFGFLIHKVLESKKHDIEAKEHRSLSVESDMAHYAGDMIVNILSAFGLLAIWYFNSPKTDAIFGILAGLWLFKTAYPIMKKSFSDICHNQASPETQQKIVEAVLECSPKIIGIHHLRSRELGPTLFVDFHMKLPGSLTLEQAHEIGDKVEANIKRIIPRADLIVHLDPDSEEDQIPWEPQYKIPPKA